MFKKNTKYGVLFLYGADIFFAVILCIMPHTDIVPSKHEFQPSNRAYENAFEIN